MRPDWSFELSSPEVSDCGFYELEIKDASGAHFMLHFTGDEAREAFIEGVRAWEERS